MQQQNITIRAEQFQL
uniref:Uncharacterized protein n=1 Tax=Arundo donax TaxID=35708 RepID=A0A0A8YSW7_ARUDO